MAKRGAVGLDPVRSQVVGRAHEILGLIGVEIEPGFTPGRIPHFLGLSTGQWLQLGLDHPAEFYELVRICESDFPTFSALLLKVVPKGGGRVSPFIFNNAQRYLWNRIGGRMAKGQPLFFVVLKARQLGITTFMACWQYWHLWRQSHVQTLMLGHVDKLAENVTKMYRIIHDSMPDVGDIKPKLRQDTTKKTARVPKGEIYITDRGERSWQSWGITGSARNIDQRGFQGTHFTGSECAFWPKLNELKDALLPQLPPPSSPKYLEASVIFESSPMGQNEFYELWTLAKNPESEWEAVFLPWFIQDDEYALEPPPGWKMTAAEREVHATLCAERKKFDGRPISMAQMYYRRHTLLNSYDGNEEAFDAEYASDDITCFMMSKNMLFQKDMRFLTHSVSAAETDAPRMLVEHGFPKGPFAQGNLVFGRMESPFAIGSKINKVSNPKFEPHKKGNLWIWEPPQAGHAYVIGADGSGGDGDRDGACAQVVCVTCGRQSAELWSQELGPDDFADHIVHLAHMYNTALLNPEVNWMGTVILKRIMTGWGYGNLAREEKWDEIQLKKHKYGFMTSHQNKDVLVNSFVSLVKGRHIQISGRGLLAEMSTFQSDGYSIFGKEKFSASSRKHDDRVIAMCLATYAIRQSPKMFSEISTHYYGSPSAVDLGLNKSSSGVKRPLPRSFTDTLPPEIANLLEGGGGLAESALPWNPMRPLLGNLR